MITTDVCPLCSPGAMGPLCKEHRLGKVDVLCTRCGKAKTIELAGEMEEAAAVGEIAAKKIGLSSPLAMKLARGAGRLFAPFLAAMGDLGEVTIGEVKKRAGWCKACRSLVCPHGVERKDGSYCGPCVDGLGWPHAYNPRLREIDLAARAVRRGNR